MSKQIDEKLLAKAAERDADKYFAKYKTHMESLEKDSLLSKVRPISQFDIVALGKQLDNWKMYEEYCNETGNINALGNMPVIALDVVTAIYGTSPLSLIASVQPIDEIHGLVYFKQLRYENTKGDITANDIAVDPRTGSKTPSGYASSLVAGEIVGTGDGTEKSFSATLAAKPVVLQTLVITVEDAAAVYCEDVGVRGSNPSIGTLLGAGVSGTINYVSGAIALVFAAAPANTKKIYASYEQNFELSTDIPKITSFMDSKHVRARAYALKGTLGMFQQFSMKKRWGKALDEEMARDLIAEVNKEVLGDAIRKLKLAATGTTSFDRKLPTGVGKNEHYESYKYSLYDADAAMVGNAGRGSVNIVIAGSSHCALVRGMRGFKLLSDSTTMGAHIFGQLDGVTYVRVPEAALMSGENGIGIFKGQSVFEAACAYAPYMPLAVTDVLPEVQNPLNNQRAAATMAAVETLVPAFATNINVIDTTP